MEKLEKAKTSNVSGNSLTNRNNQESKHHPLYEPRGSFLCFNLLDI